MYMNNVAEGTFKHARRPQARRIANRSSRGACLINAERVAIGVSRCHFLHQL